MQGVRERGVREGAGSSHAWEQKGKGSVEEATVGLQAVETHIILALQRARAHVRMQRMIAQWTPDRLVISWTMALLVRLASAQTDCSCYGSGWKYCRISGQCCESYICCMSCGGVERDEQGSALRLSADGERVTMANA